MTDKAKQFGEILSAFNNAMLVTRTSAGQLRARPMAVAKVDSDADLWFITDIDAGKVDEIDDDSNVAVVMQNGSQYLSISGTASVSRDKKAVRDLWQEPWRVWFPDGPDSHSLALVHVQSTSGEYWDTAGLKGLEYLFEAGRAYFAGDRPEVDHDQHAKVSLG